MRAHASWVPGSMSALIVVPTTVKLCRLLPSFFTMNALVCEIWVWSAGRPGRAGPSLAERPRRLELDRELCSLEQPLQPAEDLCVRERQLLQRPRADVRRELVQLLVERVRERFAKLRLDRVEHPAKVIHRAFLGADAPCLLEHLARDPSDAEQALGIDHA